MSDFDKSRPTGTVLPFKAPSSSSPANGKPVQRQSFDPTGEAINAPVPHHTFGHPAPIFPNPMTRRQARMIATALNAYLDVSEQLVLVALIGETGDTDNISAMTSFILKEQARLGVFAPQDAPAWRQHLHHHLMDLRMQGG